MNDILCMVYSGTGNIYRVHQPEEGTFFHTLENTQVSQEYNMTEYGKVFILRDINEDHLMHYTSYLLGHTDFEWNKDIMDFFDLMGHPNTHGYEINYWKVKLVHDRICKLELMTLFLIEEENMRDIEQLIPLDYGLSKDNISTLYNEKICSRMILRHDNCTYTTYLGYYTLSNNVNWYEEEKHSKTYILDLIQEQMKNGFKIMIPDDKNIDIDIEPLMNEMLDEYYGKDDNFLYVISDYDTVDIDEVLELYEKYNKRNNIMTLVNNVHSRLVSVKDIKHFICNHELLHKYIYYKDHDDNDLDWLLQYLLSYRDWKRYPKDLMTNLLIMYNFGFSFISFPNIGD